MEMTQAKLSSFNADWLGLIANIENEMVQTLCLIAASVNVYGPNEWTQI